ncbi:MAG: hydrogenase maturation protease [Armatimonadota bacterium]
MATHGILLVGVGNPYRQDDGAGIAVVRRLRPLLQERVECVECTGDLIALMDIWQGYEQVVVIDAMHSGRSAGEVIRLDASRRSLPADGHFSFTHAMGLNETLALAHALNQMPPKLVIYGIEGKHFGEGEALSAEVAKAVEDVVRYILQELREGNGDA